MVTSSVEYSNPSIAGLRRYAGPNPYFGNPRGRLAVSMPSRRAACQLNDAQVAILQMELLVKQ